MRIKEFKKLMKKDPREILEEYMLGKHGTLTENQLQKIIDKKKGTFEEGHGGCAFGHKRRKKVK